MNKVKIKGSYTETLNFLQESLNPEDLKGFKYLKPLQEIQKRALKESLGKPFRDPICDYIIKNKLVGRVRDNGIMDALSYSYGDLSRFIETNYTDKILEDYGKDVIIPEFVHFSPLEDIKAQLIEYKRMEAEEKAHHFFRDSKGIERFSNITFKALLEDYYSGFEYEEGNNTPSLKKQLTSQNIAFKEDHLKIWGEVKAWFENYYTGKPNFHKGYHYRTLIYNYFDDKIEDISKKWAFCGSCHAERKTGSDTPKILDAIGYKMLKFYCLDEDFNLIPSTRIYYYQEGENVAFSGTYTNFGNGEMAKSAYSFTIAMMCFIFSRKFEDFKEIEGMNINTGELEDVGIRFYANTSQDSKYKQFGTAEILSGLHLDADDAYHILSSK